ncbi:MAG: hypothetical protein ACLQG3_06620 [Terracidiphilus sp.]
MAEFTANRAAAPAPAQTPGPPAANADLLSALAGKQAGRDRAVADHTRRVVSTSLGVMRDQNATRRRTRSIALAALVLALFAFGPLGWHAADDLIGGDRIGDVTAQTSLWACILFPIILAAFLVAGWSRNKD